MTGFSLEELFGVFRQEKASRGLTELPEEFYKDVAKYISRLTFEIKHGDPIRRDLLQEELENVVYMVQEIHLTRVLKALDVIARGRLPSPALEQERYAFSEMRHVLDRLQAEVVSPAVAGEVEVEPPHERTHVPMIMLADIPERIVGVDMRNYGPFYRGEVVTLPEKNAEAMIKHGVARRIAVRV